MSIGDWLARREQLSPDKVALLEAERGCRPITYRDWNRAANRTAHLLRQLGVAKGDRVAVLAMNGTPYLDLWFACGKLGAILQTLNWRLTVPELLGLIQDADPRLLVYGPEFLPQVDGLLAQLERPMGLVALGAPAHAWETAFDDRETLPDDPPPPVELSWDDPWVLCYTGGSTGLPKGAILTYRAITANSVNTIVSWGVRPDDLTLLNAPLFHTGGLNVLTAPLAHLGGTSILCRGFDPDQVFDLLRDQPVTLLFGVPAMFIALQQHPRWDAVDLSRLRWVISGGAPCPLPVFERFWDKGVEFKTGYGLTEAGPNTFWLPAEQVRRKPGAVGYPLFHVETRLVNAAGGPCGPDEVGQLLIRGPHVCGGYWNRPEETARAFADGWLHTGDLARRDAEGCHSIVGRLKDLIISGGENIYPAEVESVLHACPGVAEAALIGVPDPRWGEVGRAIVVPRAGARLTPADLDAFCQARLARYKIPKSNVLTNALPRTAAGKLDKPRLQAAYGGPFQEREHAQGTD